MIIKNKYYNQTEIFKLWFEENKHKFKNTIIVVNETDSYLLLKYQDIAESFFIKVDNNSSIEITQGEDNKLIESFLVLLSIDKDNNYYNEALQEQERKYYQIPEPVYYDEYNLFLKWSNENLSNE